MKNKLSFFLFISMGLLITLLPTAESQAQRLSGSRNVITEVRDVPYFDAVKVGGAIDLIITQGDDFYVEVHADDNIMPNIETRVRQGVLEINLRPRLSLRNFRTMKVYVTAPLFSSIETSGSSDVHASNTIIQESLYLKASGSSDFRMDIDVRYLDLQSSGSSDAFLSGQAESIKARLSGSGDLRARDLSCEFLEIQLSGSSDAFISVGREVKGRLSGSSDLRIYGNPIVNVRTSGSSSVRKGR